MKKDQLFPNDDVEYEMKRITTILISVVVGLFVSNAVVSLVVAEWRINDLRNYVRADVTHSAIEKAISVYKEEYKAGEHMSIKKRNERDKRIKAYLQRLDKIMNAD